jgi:uncharacterized protein (DUF2235 family)
MSRRLVVCCDGTWNEPDRNSRGGGGPTNVTKLALGVAGQDAEGNEQLIHYEKGVGTRRFERFSGGAFGFGLSRNVIDGYRFLVEAYDPGDELYFFGFSRGAFTARSLAGLVRNSGILRRQHAGQVEEAYRLYRSRADEAHPTGVEAQLFRRMYSHDDPDMRFIGVWETVGSLGIPLDIKLINDRWGFHDTDLSSRVRFAYQALAIDERRKPFSPTVWKQQPGTKGQTLEQVWFAGVHSDVGGGYEDPELAEITLLWMVERASQTGLAFLPDHFATSAGPLDDKLRQAGEQVAPDALGPIHDSFTGVFRLGGSKPRVLAGADGGKVASSAKRRSTELGDYRPEELVEYLAGGAEVAPVRDGS